VLQRQIAEHVTSLKPAEGQTTVQLQQDPLGLAPQDLNLGYLDEAWPALWNEDLTNFYTDDTEQNMLNMYLLGLPPIEN
jgi:hypothetical protein